VSATDRVQARDERAGADDYRDFMSMFPTGVAVVTATDHRGIPHGMTCTALASVTLSPPTLLVCLNSRSGTLAAVRARGVFAVHLLHSGGQRTAELFGSAAPDRFDQVPWAASPATSVPLLADVAAIAECRLLQAMRSGDHQVILGTVTSTACRDDALPLTYGMRRFTSWEPAR
jgi:flavin reductase (DIM6/NTAB) family NADH-FMN oxidoreductase RutF